MEPQPTQDLLRRYGEGDVASHAALVARLGTELRELARAHFQRGGANGLLQPTVLVNEVWLRLVEREGLTFESRSSFFAFCSRVMRNLLVDAARARVAAGEQRPSARISLAGEAAEEEGSLAELLDVEDALNDLEQHDPEAARLVELRFFGGLEHRDIAAALGVSESTVDRRWRFARAWLRARLNG